MSFTRSALVVSLLSFVPSLVQAAEVAVPAGPAQRAECIAKALKQELSSTPYKDLNVSANQFEHHWTLAPSVFLIPLPADYDSATVKTGKGEKLIVRVEAAVYPVLKHEPVTGLLKEEGVRCSIFQAVIKKAQGLFSFDQKVFDLRGYKEARSELSPDPRSATNLTKGPIDPQANEPGKAAVSSEGSAAR